MFVIYILTNIPPTIGPEEITRLTEGFTRDATNFNSIYGIVGYTMGFVFSLLGGYVCAHFAREHWKKAVLILGASVSVLGFLMATGSYSFANNLFLGLLTFVVILLGGWLNNARREKHSD